MLLSKTYLGSKTSKVAPVSCMGNLPNSTIEEVSDDDVMVSQ